MKIGGFKVGDYQVKEDAGKKKLYFKCKDCVYGASIADDRHCMYHVLSVLDKVDADQIILSDVYERIYDENQTQMLSEIAALKQKFESENMWSYSRLGKSKTPEQETDYARRYKVVVRIAHDLISFDPIMSYLTCLQEFAKENEKIANGTEEYKEDAEVYLQTLNYLKESFEQTELIKKAKKFLLSLKEVPETKDIYKSFFEAELKPAFIGARLTFRDDEKLVLLDDYNVLNSNVQIFEHPNETQNLYFINPPEYSLTPDKYFVLSKAKEVVAGYKPGKTSLSTVAQSRKYFERIYRSTIKDIAEQNDISLTPEEIKELSSIVARYTVGYGILEILLSDRKITDIYLDSPIGQNPIYLVHSDYGQCRTNVMYTENEAQALVTKMRAMSGRPFDEAHPVLDLDLEDLDTRVAVIGPPLAPDGIAFAFRLHKLSPWTLSQFIDVDFLNPMAAGLISFFIDNQATMLVTGSRGSGKTSLLGSCMQEILKSARIIVQEDTLELPAEYMKRIGFNVQRLKTRSPIGVSKSETEVSPEDSLRTALRLGDSALVLGEVRSTEAKTLYEAMRVGAAGNIVMGTIHGDSAYSVWDRVVNDLGVPSTSFKATDLIVVARPIRFAGSLKRQRRVVQLTEVGKNWTDDPQQEDGLLDLMLYDAKKDKLELLEENFKKSVLFEKISRTSGLTTSEMWKEITMRGNSKSFMVEMKNKHKIPNLLEAENTSVANDKLLLLKQRQIDEHGKVDYDEVLKEWKQWFEKSLVKKVLSEKG